MLTRRKFENALRVSNFFFVSRELKINFISTEYGNIADVVIREKGILRNSGISAVVTFSLIIRDDLLKESHQIRNQPIKIREFLKSDLIDAVNDDWEADEKNSPYPSNNQKVPSCASSRVSSPLPKKASISRQSSYSSRTSESSSISGIHTRSVMIRDKSFDKEMQEKVKEFFSQYGRVEKVTRIGNRRPSGYELLFIKFQSYETAEKVLASKSVEIEGNKYEVRLAKDL